MAKKIKKRVSEVSFEASKFIEAWDQEKSKSDHYKEIFEGLIKTMERNAKDGKAIIYNVEL